MAENSQLFLDDVTTPEGSLREARELAERVVSVHLGQERTRERVIQSLTRRYRFDTWLLRLLRGDKVSDKRHMIARLEKALEEAVRIQRRNADADEALDAALKRRAEKARSLGVGISAANSQTGPVGAPYMARAAR